MRVLVVRHLHPNSHFPDAVASRLSLRPVPDTGWTVATCPPTCRAVKRVLHHEFGGAPDAVLWFRMPPFSPAFILKLKARGVRQVWFNVDAAPRFWGRPSSDLVRLMDTFFTCNARDGTRFASGSVDVKHVYPSPPPPGPQPQPVVLPRFDVALAITTTYASDAATHPRRYVDRTPILDALNAVDPTRLRVGLFGPPDALGNWSNIYAGHLPSSAFPALASASKLMLDVPGCVLETNDAYLNERCVATLAAGSAVLVTPCVTPGLVPGRHVVTYAQTVDPDSLVDVLRRWASGAKAGSRRAIAQEGQRLFGPPSRHGFDTTMSLISDACSPPRRDSPS